MNVDTNCRQSKKSNLINFRPNELDFDVLSTPLGYLRAAARQTTKHIYACLCLSVSLSVCTSRSHRSCDPFVHHLNHAYGFQVLLKNKPKTVRFQSFLYSVTKLLE